MDTTSAYLIAFCAVFVLPLALLIARPCVNAITPSAQRYLTSLRYRTLLEWTPWPRVTLFRLSVLLVYIGANVAALFAVPRGEANLGKRFAVVASINLMAVFLGGRTNPLASYISISLPSYYAIHHWISLTAILQLTVHSILALVRRRQSRNNLSSISGYVVSGTRI